MAQVRRYRCPHCDYEATVSGGEDRGLELYTQTVVCRECRELRDVPSRRFMLPQGIPLNPDPTAKPLLLAWLRFKLGEIARSLKTGMALSQLAHLQHYWAPVAMKCPNGPNHSVDKWYGIHLPLEHSDPSRATSAATELVVGGNCPRCNKSMLRSQPLATWE